LKLSESNWFPLSTVSDRGTPNLQTMFSKRTFWLSLTL
jgi:hypothetical protein